MERNLKNIKGITLIVLVITIVVLIILVGVAINLTLGDNGIFNKVKYAKEKYTLESIREKVEIGIMNIEIQEVALGNEITIELVLQELLEEGIFETIDKLECIGDIGEYEVKLKYNEDRKVVIEYIEKATGVRVTYRLKPVGYTNGDKVSILLTVKGKVKSVTKPDNLVIYPENEIVAINYEVTSNGTYPFIIENEEGNKQEKNVIVDTIDKLAPNDFTITAKDISATGFTILAKTEDKEADGVSVKSGIEKYEYFVKGESDIEYKKYNLNIISELTKGIYDVYVVAYDKAGNTRQSQEIEVEAKLTINFSKADVSVHTFAGIDSNGDIWSGGYNYYGELGNGKVGLITQYTFLKISPTNVKFNNIKMGGKQSVAIDENGNLWATGEFVTSKTSYLTKVF